MNKKQILAVALVIVIIAAGVLQYIYSDKGFSSKNDNEEERLGEAVYVDNITGDAVNLTDGTKADASENDNAVTGAEQDYFTQARLERDAIRSRQKEELKELTSSSAGEEIAAKAQQEYMDLIRRAEIEATIESLIKQRGIEDVVVIFGSTGTVDLVVKAESLSQSETAQISDIVMRHAGVEMKDIHIKNMK